MQRLLNAYANAFQKWMPSPFAIAVLLTALSAILALQVSGPAEVLGAWVEGLWNAGLIRFGFQAMFMLVLGHVLALAPPVLRALDRGVLWVLRSPRLAAPKVAAVAMALGWLNWGLGLVGGAILVRGALDALKHEGNAGGVHPGVLGAAGYTGLLVWHGGLSGSAPLKVCESGHLQSLAPTLVGLPDAIGLADTVFAPWSVSITLVVFVAVLGVFSWLAQSVQGDEVLGVGSRVQRQGNEDVMPSGFGDWADGSRLLPWALGLACLAGAGWWAVASGRWTDLGFITPDWINTVLLGSALLAHGSVRSLLAALGEAIQGASGILVQFPLYFGIMGLVTGTGLGGMLAEALVGATDRDGLPFALFLASGVLNVFVPSGGGQWAVQGPLVLESCQTLGLPLEKGIMAMAFGDELTNMLQPFWALPLLGITGLKAREILPYTLLVMLVAGTVMAVGLAVI